MIKGAFSVFSFYKLVLKLKDLFSCVGEGFHLNIILLGVYILGKAQDRCMMVKKILGPHRIEILKLVCQKPP